MNFTYVQSTDIAAIAKKLDNLVIKFNNGGIYEYKGAAVEFENLLNASSKGKYFHENVKNKYPYLKIN